ncbi:MAG: phosphoribosylformylglycinamidine synthase subunit PurS [Cyanobacteriota bacterium]|nr:phosphoribosylformylglycinamidine synthase subunit PurS [Cyanobacteriota bacterium]
MTKKYLAQIYVTLRPSVSDPAGNAVRSGLAQMGYDNVDRLRIGKYIEMTVSAGDPNTAKEQIDAVCDRLLANPVIENYRFELQEQPNAVVQ